MSALEDFVRRLTRVERGLRDLQRQPQLASSSIEDGQIREYTVDGTIGSQLGRQYDGTHTAVSLSGPVPGPTTAPILTTAPGVLLVQWDGAWADGPTVVAPMDHARVEAHVATNPDLTGELFATLVGTIESARGGEVAVSGLPPDTDLYARLVARTQSGGRAPASAVVGPVRITVVSSEDVADARAAASTALATANGKNTVFYQNTAPPTTGRTVGDLWFQTDADNQPHRWAGDDDQWVVAKLGDAALASLTVGKIVTGELAAGQRIIVGPEIEKHVELSDSGFRVYNAGDGGLGDEVMRFGTQEDDYFAIVDANGKTLTSFDPLGAINSKSITTTDWPTVLAADYDGSGGGRLDQILDRRPRRLAGFGQMPNVGPIAGMNDGVGNFEFSATLYGGRMYTINSASIRVSPVPGTLSAEIRLVGTQATANVDEVPPNPTVTNGYVFARTQMTFVAGYPATVPLSGLINPLLPEGSFRNYRFLLVLAVLTGDSSTYVQIRPQQSPAQVWLADAGPVVEELSQINQGNGTVWSAPATTPPAPPAPPAKSPPKTYTRTFLAAWNQTYRQDGGNRSDTAGDLYQGYGDSYNGNTMSFIGWGSFGGILAGATVTRVRVFLFAEHWWYGGGGTALIGSHGYASPPNTNGSNRAENLTASAGWPRAGGRWVDITSWSKVSIKTGTMRGIVLGAGSAGTNRQYYGRFSGKGQSNQPVLELTYTV